MSAFTIGEDVAVAAVSTVASVLLLNVVGIVAARRPWRGSVAASGALSTASLVACAAAAGSVQSRKHVGMLHRPAAGMARLTDFSASQRGGVPLTRLLPLPFPGIVTRQVMRSLAGVATAIFVPCLSISSLGSQLSVEVVREVWPLLVWSFVNVVLSGVLSWVVIMLTRIPHRYRVEFMLGSTFSVSLWSALPAE